MARLSNLLWDWVRTQRGMFTRMELFFPVCSEGLDATATPQHAVALPRAECWLYNRLEPGGGGTVVLCPRQPLGCLYTTLQILVQEDTQHHNRELRIIVGASDRPKLSAATQKGNLFLFQTTALYACFFFTCLAVLICFKLSRQ